MALKGEHIGIIASAEANAALAYKYRFVTLTGGKLAYCGAGAQAVGVIADTFASGEDASYVASGIVKVELSATVAALAKVEATANGEAQTKSSGIDLGTALTGGDDGDLILVKLHI